MNSDLTFITNENNRNLLERFKVLNELSTTQAFGNSRFKSLKGINFGLRIIRGKV